MRWQPGYGASGRYREQDVSRDVMGKGRDRLAQSRFTVAARDEWLVPCNHRESDSASDGKVQFSLVQSPFFPNPEPNHQFSSGDLPEP